MNTLSITQAEANELFVYASNHPDVEREMVRPIVNILGHHVRNGSYSEPRALKAWGHVVEMAARRYCAAHGGPLDHWTTMFPVDTQRAVCVLLGEHYADRIDDIAATAPKVRLNYTRTMPTARCGSKS